MTPEPGSLEALTEIALDLRWSWSHASDRLWEKLDPELWDLTRNPWLVLQSASRRRLDELLADPQYQFAVDEVARARRDLESRPLWFAECHPEAAGAPIAYFSMEFMLSEALPIYSGGLGNVAGDHLKSASDLGVPVVGVGLLYQQGYFRQEIDSAGEQQALYPFNEPGQLPIQPVRNADGEWLRLAVDFPGWRLWIRCWEARVGRIKLYLLDTNDPGNLPAYRSLAGELYGGGLEARLRQEMLLGIGGWRLLCALGLAPEVCHLNEGHAAFAVLERARSWMAANNQPFDRALAVTRAGNLFTTHTPVDAGFDRFPEPLIRQYLGRYAEQELRIPFDALMRLGRDPAARADGMFNMACLALRGCGAANGVSRMHSRVSRRLFSSLFPRWPEDEVPVGHVTNGVHMPTWDSQQADELWTNACGKARWMGTLDTAEAGIRSVPDEQLWAMRANVRKRLVEFTRRRILRDRSARGWSTPPDLPVLDPNALTLGLARRFAVYKRPTLLLRDRDRLARLLSNPNMPVQLIVAGKAHPDDAAGRAMIREWTDFVRRPGVASRAVFLSDYDMLLADELVHGVDLWINTPRRPWEACGTSGMKVLVNGGLNLSASDGWWAEAEGGGAGWTIGSSSAPGSDDDDAAALYGLLEQEIVPMFYRRGPDGIPREWVACVRESLARLTPMFSANRSVRQYAEEYYLPLTAAFRSRSAGGGAIAADVLAWSVRVAALWPNLRFGELQVESRDGRHTLEIPLYLGELEPDAVRVEIYAAPANGTPPVHHEMTRVAGLVGAAGGYRYSATVPDDRPATAFTPRVVPHHPAAVVPLESNCILWQR